MTAAPPPSTTAPRDGPHRCDAGIVFAVPIEADAFERLVADRVETRATRLVFHEGSVAGRRVAWCVGGVGGQAAAEATRLLVDGHRPALVITAGFAGGLDPGIRRGSVVRPVRSIGEPDQEPVPLWTGPVPEDSPGLTIVSVPRVAATVEAKRRLRERTAADLVDMETHAVARAAATAGLPCGCVRVVSDDASQELPGEVGALAEPQSSMRRLGRALGAIGRRPRAAVDLWRLWEHAVVDGRVLAAAVVEMLRGLPGSPSGP